MKAIPWIKCVSNGLTVLSYTLLTNPADRVRPVSCLGDDTHIATTYKQAPIAHPPPINNGLFPNR